MKTALLSILVLAFPGCAELHDPAADSSQAPPPAQPALERLRSGLSRSSEGLVIEQRTDGITKVHLQGRFQHATVVGPDGRAACVDSAAALDRIRGAKR